MEGNDSKESDPPVPKIKLKVKAVVKPEEEPKENPPVPDGDNDVQMSEAAPAPEADSALNVLPFLVVWAQYADYPSCPAELFPLDSVPSKALLKGKKKGLVLVRFLAEIPSKAYGWVKVSGIDPYRSHAAYHKDRSKSKTLPKAMLEAESLLETNKATRQAFTESLGTAPFHAGIGQRIRLKDGLEGLVIDRFGPQAGVLYDDGYWNFVNLSKTEYYCLAPEHPPPSNGVHGHLVGLSVSVFWAEDNDWYSGRITRVSPESEDMVTVEYDDGEYEDVDLEDEDFRIVRLFEKPNVVIPRDEYSFFELSDMPPYTKALPKAVVTAPSIVEVKDVEKKKKKKEKKEKKKKKEKEKERKKAEEARVSVRHLGKPQPEYLSDDDSDESMGEVPVQQVEDTGPKIEKLLGVRYPRPDGVPEITDGTNPYSSSDQNEYLVKWKEMSYIHCEWVTEGFVLQQRQGKSRLAKFHLNLQEEGEKDYEFFNPDYIVAERVLSEDPGGTEQPPRFLVKWHSLPYCDSTWEVASDIGDNALIEKYRKFNTPAALPANVQRRDTSTIAEIDGITFADDRKLRPYQVEGMKWLAACWHASRNSILADEMGLGKTVQTVSILWYLWKTQKIRGPFLVIAPLSTIPHWQREVESWTDFNTVFYHGSKDSRAMIRQHEFYCCDKLGREIKYPPRFDVLITTYEMVVNDPGDLRNIRWKYLVVDEAHRLKNKSSRLHEISSTYKSEHILLLTGTPLQNNIEELHSLLKFLRPKKYHSEEEFMEKFGDQGDSKKVVALQNELRAYLLRRLKTDVEKSIPPKEETIIEVELTSLQKQYYRAILERNLTFLAKGGKASNAPKLLNIMAELRKCCNHVFLIKGARDRLSNNVTHTPEALSQLMVETSGKVVLLDKLLPKLKAGGHRVLLFSQMVKMLDLIAEYLSYKSYRFERLDGCIRGTDRQAAIDRFNRPNSDSFIFLLSTRAGGVGINLTSADTVIIFDSDMNPQNDLQAQSRCHRIGQKQEVKIYRLVTRKTYERQLFDRASKKLGLEHAVLSDIKEKGEDGQSGALSAKEIDQLLKHGAYNFFQNDEAEEKESADFCEADIDSILTKSSRVQKYDFAGTKGQSTFAKATFVSEGAEPAIDINDPDFWRKLMPGVTDLDTVALFVKDKTNSTTKEGKDKIMKDLEKLVKDALQAREDGEEVRSDELSGLLHVVVGNQDFDELQRAQLELWIQEMSRPKRSRTQVKRLVDDSFHNTNDLVDDLVEKETKEAKGSKKQQYRPPKGLADVGWEFLTETELQERFDAFKAELESRFREIKRKQEEEEMKKVEAEMEKKKAKRVAAGAAGWIEEILAQEGHDELTEVELQEKFDYLKKYFIQRLTKENVLGDEFGKKAAKKVVLAVTKVHPLGEFTLEEMYELVDALKEAMMARVRPDIEMAEAKRCETIRRNVTEGGDRAGVISSRSQVEALENYFQEDPYPGPKLLDAMASSLNLMTGIVARWFQLRRSRKYKELRRSNPSAAMDGCLNVSIGIGTDFSVDEEEGIPTDDEGREEDSVEDVDIDHMSSSEEEVVEEKVKKKPPPINLPQTFGPVTVVALGEIEPDRPAYVGRHSSFPIGFKSVRHLKSIADPTVKVMWQSEILDGGVKPLFRLTIHEDPPTIFEGNSATQPWHKAFQELNSKVQTRRIVSVSGPDMYGLSHPQIQALIKLLPRYDEIKLPAENLNKKDTKVKKARKRSAPLTKKDAMAKVARAKKKIQVIAKAMPELPLSDVEDETYEKVVYVGGSARNSPEHQESNAGSSSVSKQQPQMQQVTKPPPPPAAQPQFQPAPASGQVWTEMKVKLPASPPTQLATPSAQLPEVQAKPQPSTQSEAGVPEPREKTESHRPF